MTPDTYGFLSLVPPLLAVVLAIATRQVYISLLAGIVAGQMVLGGSVIDVFLSTLQRFVGVFEDPGNTRTILFSCLVGALIVLMQKSGGVAGFIDWVQKIIARKSAEGATKQVQLLAWATGILVFVESSISVLTVGTLFRPLFDNMKISREKLAYIADSSSAPVCILLPLNAWGAFIMGLLATQGESNPLGMFVQSMAYAFYPIVALLLVPLVIWFGWDFSGMQMADARVQAGGPVISAGGVAMTGTELTETLPEAETPKRAVNMLLPIVSMVLLMPTFLAITGWEAALSLNPTGSSWDLFITALGQGSGSTSVLAAVTGALTLSIIAYRAQGLMSLREMSELTLKGLSAMLPLALLMLFAFAISSLCKELGTGTYVASYAADYLVGWLGPALIFLVSGFIAFSTGTSWGTFAIMVPIALPVATALGIDPAIGLAAALGGGVFGDHCSPISDTTILASMAAATDHIDHVRTQLPYALIGGGIAILGYIVLAVVG
jgi:Na+/H+ antiporter NhaC